MSRPFRVRNRRLLAAVSGVSIFVSLFGITGASAGASTVPAMNCQPETYPPAGIARSDTKDGRPYGIPFTASLAGGYLTVSSPNSMLSVTLGAPVVDNKGTLMANACGLTFLPNQNGTITANPSPGASGNNDSDQYNNNFEFDDPINISVSLTGTNGAIPVLAGQASADGELVSQFDPVPAANGGINVIFSGTSKATSTINPLALANLLTGSPNLPPAIQAIVNQIIDVNPKGGMECTLVLGDSRAAGVPTSDLTSATGLDYKDATTPAVLTTATSTALASNGTVVKQMTGEPVTGPITAAQAMLVSDNFPVGKIDPNTVPSPTAPGANQTPSTLCTPSNASLLNQLLGLPSPAGYNVFSAPGTFAIKTSA